MVEYSACMGYAAVPDNVRKAPLSIIAQCQARKCDICRVYITMPSLHIVFLHAPPYASVGPIAMP